MLNRTMLNKSTPHKATGGLHCEKCRLVRRRVAGGKHFPRMWQGLPNLHCERMRATEHTPRDPIRVLERRGGLAEIGERRAVVEAKCPRVSRPHPEREFVTLSEHAPRHGYRFAKQCLGFFEAP